MVLPTQVPLYSLEADDTIMNFLWAWLNGNLTSYPGKRAILSVTQSTPGASTTA